MNFASSKLVDGLCLLKAQIGMARHLLRTGMVDGYRLNDDAIYEEMLSEGRIAAFTEISGYKYWTTIDQLYSNSYYIIDFNQKSLKDSGKDYRRLN